MGIIPNYLLAFDFGEQRECVLHEMDTKHLALSKPIGVH